MFVEEDHFRILSDLAALSGACGLFSTHRAVIGLYGALAELTFLHCVFVIWQNTCLSSKSAV